MADDIDPTQIRQPENFNMSENEENPNVPKVPSKVEPFAQLFLGAGVSIAFHPMTYTKVLIQLGHEPLAPIQTTSIFGRKVLAFPSVLKYIGHIRRTDGFLGMYRGLGARLTGGIIGSLVTNSISNSLHQPNEAPEGEIDEDAEALEGLKRLCKDTSNEMIARCAGVLASQPFHVIMIRCMAQFVGKETQYNSVFSSIGEIYEKEGIRGFFAGLIPRLLGEALTIWLANSIVYLINTYLMPADRSVKGFKSYSSAICTMMVTQVTYPFSLVSNIMAVSNSGLAASSPPYMPLYDGWRHCFSSLRLEGQLKRGSSLFWRYYKGPVIIGYDGWPMPAKQVWSS